MWQNKLHATQKHQEATEDYNNLSIVKGNHKGVHRSDLEVGLLKAYYYEGFILQSTKTEEVLG